MALCSLVAASCMCLHCTLSLEWCARLLSISFPMHNYYIAAAHGHLHGPPQQILPGSEKALNHLQVTTGPIHQRF